MLVLPFFLVAVSDVNGGAGAAEASTAADAEVNAVEGKLAISEARRLRGFAGGADMAV